MISNVAIAQAVATFIDECAPSMGMCTVWSEPSSRAWLTPRFSEPSTRQMRSPAATGNSRMSMLALVSSRLTMR